MDSKFTIVIPYYAIPETIDFVKRQLNYYHFNSTPMAVILAVSGDEIVKVELEQFIKELNDPRFSMLTVEETDIANMESWLIKIYEGLKKVKTKYVIINGADDVIILESALYGIDILDKNHDISAVKGIDIFLNCQSGEMTCAQVLEIYDKDPINRVKKVMQRGDSLFYMIRSTKSLEKTFKSIIDISVEPRNFRKSAYHIAHLVALCDASLGKIHVLDYPWRIQSYNSHNSVSYSRLGFDLVELGGLDRVNYVYFKSMHENIFNLNYINYLLLWVYNQIKETSMPLMQIMYEYIYKSFNLKIFTRAFFYFLLNKIYCIFKPGLFNELDIRDFRYLFYNVKYDGFLKPEQYNMLVKYYFSDNLIKLINSCETTT